MITVHINNKNAFKNYRGGYHLALSPTLNAQKKKLLAGLFWSHNWLNIIQSHVL